MVIYDVKENLYDDIKDEVIKMYTEGIISDELTEGKIRTKNGNLFEDMAQHVLERLMYANGLNGVVLRDSETKYFHKSKNSQTKVNLDRQIEYKNEPIICVEAKTYFDKSMARRAWGDSYLLKTLFPKTKTVVLMGEKAISDSELIYQLDTYIDRAFVLVDGCRSSDKPLWKVGNSKFINEETLLEFIKYADSIVKEYV